VKFLLLLYILFLTTVNALTFTVATYNVENLFDLKYQGNEYLEFKPHTKKWNKKKLENKLKNITKVLNTKKLDIVSLQEIESKEALDLLLQKLPQYKYSHFYKKPNSAIGLSIISKYPIISNDIIPVQKYNKRSRDILKSTILIDNKKLIIFTNHWRSKKAGENARIPYAIALMKHLQTINKDIEYLILGDLNSNYNEYKTFKYNKKLNTTSGITGINQILNTTIKQNFITKNNIKNQDEIVHYNLWLEKSKYHRYSYKYRGEKETPDNIILAQTLFDNKNISYIDNSFDVLYSKNKQSDHLLIYASFSTNKAYSNIGNTPINNSASSVYKVENIEKPININNSLIIYKISSNSAIAKEKGKRAIYLYKCAGQLKIGNKYNFTINEIDNFNGLIEVTNISNIKSISDKKEHIKNYFLEAKDIDIFNLKYQNEIVKNLKGIYKNRYLYFTYNGKNKKIRLYAKDKNILPKDNQNIIVNSGHISIYKSKVQITLHKKSDYIVIKK
jgi:endonuclease/exonuclease/phosphatase family metal-dependent hydrolase